MHRLSLAARLTGIVLVALLAIWLIAISNFYRSIDWDGQNIHPAPGQIVAIATLFEQATPEQRPLLLTALRSDALDVRLDGRQTRSSDEVAEADETLMKEYAPSFGNRAFTVSTVTGQIDTPRWLGIPVGTRKVLEFRIGLANGVTLIIENRSPAVVSRRGLPVGLGAGFIGTVIALIALVVAYRETRPLSQLARAVDRMDLAGTPVPLPQVRPSAFEVRAVIAAFDRLQTRLSHLLRARMAMLGGISHDVRTFATRLRLRVDLIPEGKERDRAISDISDMIRLLDDALLASRAGAGELASELLEFDELVAAEVEDRRSAGAAIDLYVAQAAIGAGVLGDRLALRRVVSNLADNALKYGHAAHLSLDVEHKGQMMVLTIDDEGPGIAPELRELLLEPFVRVETSRNRETGGAGLGLAIVRNLVDAHGGHVDIADAPAGGTRFVVRIPLFIAS